MEMIWWRNKLTGKSALRAWTLSSGSERGGPGDLRRARNGQLCQSIRLTRRATPSSHIPPRRPFQSTRRHRGM